MSARCQRLEDRDNKAFGEKTMRKTYAIEYLMEQPINRKYWVPMTGFQYMQKSFAEGAFCMLKSLYGGNKKYRLIDSEGKVIAEWNTGTVGVA